MEQVFSTNPLLQGLNEQKQTQAQIEEVKKANWTVNDYRGDKWVSKSNLVRNETHPHYVKPSKHDVKSEIEATTSPLINRVSGWHNQRTGEVHEGGVTLQAGGHARIGDGEYSSRYFHITHYNEKK